MPPGYALIWMPADTAPSNTRASIKPALRANAHGVAAARSARSRTVKLGGHGRTFGKSRPSSMANPARRAIAEQFGMTHFVNPSEVGAELVPHLVNLTGGGADYSFECVGNVELMRQALECCHKGWGVSVIIGVAPAGAEIKTRPFQLVTGRVWKGSAFGGARGRRDVPKIVDWYMDGKVRMDELITHTLPHARINEAFDLMHSGESIRTVVTNQERTVLRA